MSEAAQGDRQVPADQIPDFEDLYARQVDMKQYVVLNLAGEEPTGYEVDIGDLLCRCKDKSYNKGSGEMCKHLAYALFQAPQSLEIDAVAFDRAVQEFQRLQEATQRLEQAATTQQASQTAEDDSGPQRDETDISQNGDAVDQSQAVEHVEEWIQTGFGPSELVQIRAGDHDGQPGVVLDPDNQTMADGQYEAFKGLVGSVDGQEVHVGFGDDPCHVCGGQDGDFWYFLPTGDALEVGQG